MTQNDNPAVLVELKEHVLIVTINRPEARNAVDAAVHLGIGLALERADKDGDVRAVILTGAGDISFCAGADLKKIARGESLRPDNAEQAAWGFAGMTQHPISKPIIGAVNGVALGGGTELALACDIVVAVEHAQFGLPEVKRGLFATAGGAFRLVEQLPRKIAMQYLLTGEPMSAQRALALGLVNSVVSPAELMDAALQFASMIAANAPLSVQATKRVAMGIVDGRIEGEQARWGLSGRESVAIYASEDAREGPAAFAKKRAPEWKGR